MQNSGTLKKRKKRNLAKVTGLTVTPYDEADDIFDGVSFFCHSSKQKSPELTYQTDGKETRVRMSALMDGGYETYRLRSHSGRVTREPMFHRSVDDPEGNFPAELYGDLPRTRSAYLQDRPNFIDKASMNRLRMLLILGATSGAFPFYWDKKTSRIEKWSPQFEKLWKIQWFIVTVQTTFLTFFQFYSFIDRVSGQNKSYREVFMNSLSVYWYVCAVYFNINMYIYKDQIRQYINTLLKFNKEYVDKYLVHTEDLDDGGRVLINLSIPSNTSQVFASVALFLVMPSKPWYLFSYIYPKPWYWLIPGAIQEYIVVGQVITSYMLTSWIVCVHTNCVQFWIRESHNHNDSDFTLDSLRHPKTAIETYRSLQILCTCFNDCMSPLAIPLVKIHIMTGLIPCGFVLIRSMNHKFVEEFPGILTYPIGVIDCASAGFVILSMSAEMFDLSVSFVDSFIKTKNKNFRRTLMSCPTLKVKVARFYHVTVSTTITFFKTTFDFITDCIITFQ